MQNIILTPNRRLCAYIQKEYVKSSNNLVWETNKIFPIKNWLEELWQVFPSEKLLLSDLQVQFIWEEIIQADEDKFLKSNATAKHAISALNIIKEWDLKLDSVLSNSYETIDFVQFKKWVEKYNNYCTNNNYIDYYDMLNLIMKKIYKLKKILPKKIIIFGFLEVAPIIKKILENLVKLEVVIEYKDYSYGDVLSSIKEATSLEDELKLAATFAKENSNYFVGIVIPNLSNIRKEVSIAFKEVFKDNNCYNISAPSSLLDYDLIFINLLILELIDNVIDYEKFSILLRSKFLKIELTQRHELDKLLREKIEDRISWELLIQFIEVEKDSVPEFFKMLYNFNIIRKKINFKRTAFKWVKFVTKMLNIWGLPNSKVTSINQQHLISSWHNMLLEYIKMANILNEHSFYNMQLILNNLAKNTPFLPQAEDKPIQVLGILEATGLPFDKLWLQGMQQDTWPQEPNPNPFIPLSIQKKYNLPRSSPERELEVAKKILKTLQKTTKKEIVYSYSAVVDGFESNVSSIIPKLKIEKSSIINKRNLVNNIINIENIEDNKIYEYAKNELEVTGVRPLQLQALCPFRAQMLRLNADKPRNTKKYLSGAERGQILHQILANLSPPNVTKADIIYNIKKVLKYWQKLRPQYLNDIFINNETNRLQKVLFSWLEFEKNREEFILIEKEKAYDIKISGLDLKIRVDRKDQIKLGKLLLDYKTFKTSTKNWLGDRPDDLQMPIYAVSDPDVSELAYYEITPENIKLNQIEITSELRLNWIEILNKLSIEFMSGNAKVSPKNTQVCRYCELDSLCRINE